MPADKSVVLLIPDMFIIDSKGILIYKGAMDGPPVLFAESLVDACNYVRRAFSEILAAKPVSVPVTKPSGCSIKY